MLDAPTALTLCQSTFPKIGWKLKHSGRTTYIRSVAMPLGNISLEDSCFPGGAWKVSTYNKVLGYPTTEDALKQALGAVAAHLRNRARELVNVL